MSAAGHRKAERPASTSGDGRRASRRDAAGLDVVLTDAAVGGPPRFLAVGSAAQLASHLARRPLTMPRRLGGLASELGKIVAGRSKRAPAKRDRRFADAAWQGNWLLRRVLQGYLAVGETLEGLIEDAELDWRADRQVRFAAQNLLDALAPTNFPWSNPAVLREVIDQGGLNFVSGARRFVEDISSPPRLPASVDVSKFEVGGNLAVTPGSVVMRNELLELIQYRSTTNEVREVPMLIVPPTINKYYIVDISPGRSLVEWLVGQGEQVFVISWRNPGPAHAHFDLNAYAEAVADARDAVAEIAGQERVHGVAACSGGIITAGLLGHLAAVGRLREFATFTLLVCVLDNARAGTTGAMTSRDVAAAAVAMSQRKGYLDGRALAEIFAWLRPNDLIWSYVVNNYLLGKPPPAFDILYWNQDTVRLAAGLHRDFIDIALENPLTRPDALEILGAPIDLAKVDLDAYVVAGLNDHIVPWENAYRTTQLLGGDTRFVLSRSGHIQAIVNPPSPDSRSSYRTAERNPAGSDEWFASAVEHRGSWWTDWQDWLSQRSPGTRAAPTGLGSAKHKPAAEAPGSYVHAH